MSWPTITVVMPSYQQGRFLEEAIRSVLLQGYPSLSFIVMDGGSTDGSVDLLEKYDPWISHWVSEPDEGQADAIRRGFQGAGGEVLAWLNSDDVLAPDALARVGEAHADGVGMILGHCRYVDEKGEELRVHRAREVRLEDLVTRDSYICQPSCFFSRAAYEACGGIDPSLELALDSELWLRLLPHAGKVVTVDAVLSWYRLHGDAKTPLHEIRSHEELYAACFRTLEGMGDPPDLRRLLERRYGAFLVRKAAQEARPWHLVATARRLARALWLNPEVLRQRSFWSALKRGSVG